MECLDVLNSEHWQPLKQFGYTHPFFNINAHTIIHTWCVLFIIIILTACIRLCLNKNSSILRFFTFKFLGAFVDTVEQALGSFHFGHFCFMTVLFIFIALCNMLALIPGLEEPTKDLNTTLALGIIAFIYTQAAVIKRHGFMAYIREYFEPFFIMLPLNIVGHLASILSIAFRLYGNIFGGATITELVARGVQAYAGPTIFGAIVLFIGGIMMVPLNIVFVIFEGLIQAFVFTMLSLTHLAIALQEADGTTETTHGNAN